MNGSIIIFRKEHDVKVKISLKLSIKNLAHILKNYKAEIFSCYSVFMVCRMKNLETMELKGNE